ncbi:MULTISPECIES: FecR family protein [unclassified Rhizobium]|uniref:FecR family protein n=1 Tax=unclassified Rhizobium TaxID=2613769 RepID=UPI001AD9E416|nr:MULTISPECIES: FecR family protein [unclassified Rhizobium]MBO9100975.1 FecR family protein [Rhizobium sp. L58/93]MBO9170745.1 FecR family protein [Rhizobium sp. L245/93]MBO9186568.1 FecR family protein [Rhizobium sp. E27B/91]QXZ86147.1 FecR family protein [Rhizobium sp. K1/93]QXZ92397.1 FecR family protein [Rhizobium sp. K15/93]
MQDISRKENCRDEDANVSRCAAEWFARLLDESATANDRASFRAWLERSPEHVKAYSELERLWQGASALPEVQAPPSIKRRNLLKSGGALLVLATAGLSATAYLRSVAADYRTGVGETARITLPDGTVAELSTATAISLNFTLGQRQVHLLEGEAFFTVAPDMQRSFVVDCGLLRSVALGTQFSVGMREEGIVVAVAQHSVRVSSPTQEQLVKEGQSVLYARNRISSPVRMDDGSQLSWRDGKLVFISTPFENVVTALSRWRHGKMIVMDRALARRPVSIIVDVRRAGRILENLENGLPIRIASYSPWLTLIYPQEKS